MRSPTEVLVNFVDDARFEHLPAGMVHELTRVFLDSVGCAFAALGTEKGRCGVALAKTFGRSSDAAVLGTTERAAAAGAAFANGELINAQDYDAAWFPTHAPPALIPAALALGEGTGASGKEMILSLALGAEISFRLGKSIRGMKKVFSVVEGSETGKIVGTKHSVSVIGIAVIAGVCGGARIVGLSKEQLAHAVGLGAHFTPVPLAKWKTLPRMPMTKYLSCGWASLAEVTALQLARIGYTADTTALDGDLGLWRFFGSDRWDPETLTENLGTQWDVLAAVEYKPYPSMRDFHVALDCFIRIIEEQHLTPTEIDHVTIKTHPSVVTAPQYRNKAVHDHIEAQFSLPYVISAAAHRISIAAWQDTDRIQDRSVQAFMQKVDQEAHPDFVKVQAQEPLSNMTTVEVSAKGRTFVAEGKYPRGLPEPDFARMTDEEVLEKFKANVSRVLSPERADKAAEVLLNLERVAHIGECVRILTP